MNYFNKNKWWLTAVIALLVVNTATLTIFWLERKGHDLLGARPKGGEAQAFIIKELALDSIQQVQYLELVKAHRNGTNAIKKELKDAKDSFYNLLGDSLINDAVVKQAAERASAIEAQLDLLTFKHFQQIRSICTPKQKAKFDTIIKTVVKMMGPNQERPQGPPPPHDKHQGERPKEPPPEDGEGPPPPMDGNGPPPDHRGPPRG
ncbi:Spy/CpxP family protein refolding chaperone [Parasediminibacterium paludis]|uniref:Spy/CpxP family protein refolding chaperone n=1 Tax=Parasediminibacterium paludis TaxID=908966 RepID=A0ABV8PX72_9BACT